MFLLYDTDKMPPERWQHLADECQRRLRDQQIVPGDPGTILKDVETMLEFIGPGGMVTKSHNASLPAERLPELNLKVSHPIELHLKRALLRDYPNLAGLFILLRVMDLLRMEGKRLVVSPAALEFWRSLNPTEQYFALLEALLFQAQSSVLAVERRSDETELFTPVTLLLRHLSEDWRTFNHYESVYTLGPKGELRPWNLFVQQQLGLVELRRRQFTEQEQRRSGAGSGWYVGSARLTPWGTAVTWALAEFWKQDVLGPEEPESEEAVPEANQDRAGLEEAPEESEPEAEFGILQPVFQPYFPEWQKVYARPETEAREGTHIFKVHLGGWRGGGPGLWRRLAVPPDTSLDGLAGAILNAFKFDRDHLYDFRYRDQRGKTRVFNHPYTDEGPFTTDITVGETGLALKDEMLFTFDYGDNWQFVVRLEKIEAKASRLSRPKVIESAGKAPKQYSSEW